jgi:hypothetical protein
VRSGVGSDDCSVTARMQEGCGVHSHLFKSSCVSLSFLCLQCMDVIGIRYLLSPVRFGERVKLLILTCARSRGLLVGILSLHEWCMEVWKYSSSPVRPDASPVRSAGLVGIL